MNRRRCQAASGYALRGLPAPKGEPRVGQIYSDVYPAKWVRIQPTLTQQPSQL